MHNFGCEDQFRMQKRTEGSISPEILRTSHKYRIGPFFGGIFAFPTIWMDGFGVAFCDQRGKKLKEVVGDANQDVSASYKVIE